MWRIYQHQFTTKGVWTKKFGKKVEIKIWNKKLKFLIIIVEYSQLIWCSTIKLTCDFMLYSIVSLVVISAQHSSAIDNNVTIKWILLTHPIRAFEHQQWFHMEFDSHLSLIHMTSSSKILYASTPPLIHPSTHPHLHASTPPLSHPSTHPPLHPSTPPPLHSATPPPIHPSTPPPLHPSTQPPLHPSTHPPLHPSTPPPILFFSFPTPAQALLCQPRIPINDFWGCFLPKVRSTTPNLTSCMLSTGNA